jgi:hypothetical protein
VQTIAQKQIFMQNFLQKNIDAATRILQFADFKGFGQSRKNKSMRQFFENCGLVNGAIRPGRSVGSDYLVKLNNAYPDLNLDWAITGRGEMIMANVVIEENKLTIAAEDDAEYIKEKPDYKKKLQQIIELANQMYGNGRHDDNEEKKAAG